ncbi:MAG: hypothetical protein ACQES9_03790 [Myxococcota bacterium]
MRLKLADIATTISSSYAKTDALNNFADIVATISSSYDKVDEMNFRIQTMTSIFGLGTDYSV